MTREEAIKRLGMGFPGSIEEGKKYGQAVDMAISALSAEGEYISKEDISRVLLERTDANKSCLSNARERRSDEGEQYFQKLVFEDEQIASLIEGLPSTDVRPNIHARWGEDRYGHIFCTACKATMPTIWKSRLCPLCGAIMDGESKVTAKVEIAGEPISKTIADMREPKGEKGTE